MKASYVVLQRLNSGSWKEVGLVERKAGLAARVSRLRAIEDATGTNTPPGVFAVLPASEWRLALDCAFAATSKDSGPESL